jgi:ornithine cyclodeaminase/alanine dehydrogenase-like protein (mu-crystallin family)
VTRLIRDSDARRLITFPEAVDVVAGGVRAAAGAPAERSTAQLESGWMRIMSGALPAEDVLGFKAFHLIPGAGVRYLISLYRLSDGEPLALIDGNYVTVARTSAAAAAAARKVFGEREIDVGIIGTGTLARDGLRALASVCRLRRARAFSRNPANRGSYASELSAELDLELTPVETPAEAAGGASMMLCATQTHGRVALTAADAGAVRYVSSVSSTLPIQRELDEHVIAAADLVVIDTDDALHEAGDLLAAAAIGLDRARVVRLADFLGDQKLSADQTVVYKSIGSVEQDLALATDLWRRAERGGRGEVIAAIQDRRS